jgi:hypothetical protein
MGGEGLDAECFGGVMAAVENIQSFVLRHGMRPVRAFAGDDANFFTLRCAPGKSKKPP